MTPDARRLVSPFKIPVSNLQFTFAGVGLLSLPMQEVLSRINFFGTPMSVNVVFSFMYFAATIFLPARRIFGIWGTVAVLMIFLILICRASVLTFDLEYVQYLLPTSIFVLLMQLRFTRKVTDSLPIYFWVAGVATAFIYIFDIFFRFGTISRASATVVPIALILILGFYNCLSFRANRFITFVAVAGILSSVSLDQSRMATGLSVFILLFFVILLMPTNRLTKVSISALVVVNQAVIWASSSNSWERWFGNDMNFAIGPLSLNGEGRVAGASIILHQCSLNSRGLIEDIFGNGPGFASTCLVENGFQLDKPHNEFLRFFSDQGVVGLIFIAAIILAIGLSGLHYWIVVRDKLSGFLLTSVFMCLIGFSITDNPFSYSWLLLPSGILIAWTWSPKRSNKIEI
jgi:hypothetical protein